MVNTQTSKPFGLTTAPQLLGTIYSPPCGKENLLFTTAMTDNHIKMAMAEMRFEILQLPNDSKACRDLEHLIVDYGVALKTKQLFCAL